MLLRLQLLFQSRTPPLPALCQQVDLWRLHSPPCMTAKAGGTGRLEQCHLILDLHGRPLALLCDRNHQLGSGWKPDRQLRGLPWPHNRGGHLFVAVLRPIWQPWSGLRTDRSRGHARLRLVLVSRPRRLRHHVRLGLLLCPHPRCLEQNDLQPALLLRQWGLQKSLSRLQVRIMALPSLELHRLPRAQQLQHFRSPSLPRGSMPNLGPRCVLNLWARQRSQGTHCQLWLPMSLQTSSSPRLQWRQGQQQVAAGLPTTPHLLLRRRWALHQMKTQTILRSSDSVGVEIYL